MAEVTDADREKALVVAHKAAVWGPDAIAKALAEEREKARVPFLALADELEQSELPLTWLVLRRRPRPEAWVLAIRAAERIRRAAEESQ